MHPHGVIHINYCKNYTICGQVRTNHSKIDTIVVQFEVITVKFRKNTVRFERGESGTSIIVVKFKRIKVIVVKFTRITV